MDSMFTTRDPLYHKHLKTPVAQLFSMTNMRNYETYVDHMIAGLDAGLRYVGVIRQYPGWHRFLIGDRLLMTALATLIPSLLDPLGRFMEVSTRNHVKSYNTV